METALVTGAAGFIGSTLSEKLLKNNLRVIGIDNFSNYYETKIKKNNLKNCIKNENFSFLNNDLISMELKPLIEKSDYIFHESGQPGVRASWGNSFETYVKDNILVTQKILEISKSQKHLKKIVMASSSSVYGNQNGVMHEETSIPRPLSPYGVTKLASENLGLLYEKNYQLPVIALRYFSVYGPRQRPDMAFCRFFNAILNQKEITIFGDGRQERDFTHVNDIVSATFHASQFNDQGTVLNIGGGHVISMKEIIKIIQDIVKTEFSTSFTERQLGDVKRTEADISKAKKLLNYNPKTRIIDGLTDEYENIKSNLSLYA